jgi:hypothetical protein
VKFFTDAADFAGKAAGTIGDLVGAASAFWGSIPAPLRDLMLKGIVADRTIHFLFGFSPIEAVGGTLLKGLTGSIFQRGSSPANPLFVSDVAKGLSLPGGPGRRRHVVRGTARDLATFAGLALIVPAVALLTMKLTEGLPKTPHEQNVIDASRGATLAPHGGGPSEPASPRRASPTRPRMRSGATTRSRRRPRSGATTTSPRSAWPTPWARTPRPSCAPTGSRSSRRPGRRPARRCTTGSRARSRISPPARTSTARRGSSARSSGTPASAPAATARRSRRSRAQEPQHERPRGRHRDPPARGPPAAPEDRQGRPRGRDRDRESSRPEERQARQARGLERDIAVHGDPTTHKKLQDIITTVKHQKAPHVTVNVRVAVPITNVDAFGKIHTLNPRTVQSKMSTAHGVRRRRPLRPGRRIVGEKGPELQLDDRSGYIYNANETRDILAGRRSGSFPAGRRIAASSGRSP